MGWHLILKEYDVDLHNVECANTEVTDALNDASTNHTAPQQC